MVAEMEAVGKSLVGGQGVHRADVDRIAAVTGDMFCACVDRLNAA